MQVFPPFLQKIMFSLVFVLSVTAVVTIFYTLFINVNQTPTSQYLIADIPTVSPTYPPMIFPTETTVPTPDIEPTNTIDPTDAPKLVSIPRISTVGWKSVSNNGVNFLIPSDARCSGTDDACIGVVTSFVYEGKTIESLQAEVRAKTLKYGEMLEKYYSQNPFHTTASFKMFLEYGNLTKSGPDDYSFLDVGGKRIAFSHYNKRFVPNELLQPNDVEVKVVNPKTGEIKIIHKNFRMAHTEDPLRLNQAFPAGADLAFYGDIHIGGYYWDQQANKLIVNPGVLNAKAKDVDEPQAYSIYNATRDEVTFWDAVQDKPLLNANLSEIQKEAQRGCNVIFKKLATLKK